MITEELFNIETKYFKAKMPFFFDAETSFEFQYSIDSEEKNGFIRFDLYPNVAPKGQVRHYGFWDVPISRLNPNSIIKLDWENRELFFLNTGNEFEQAMGIFYPLEEHGYAVLHVSLWQIIKNENEEKVSQEYSVPHMTYLKKAQGDSLPLLKQINIPVTDRCNLKCIMCPRNNQPEKLIEKDCEDLIIERLTEDIPSVMTVLLNSLGEPLLYKKLYKIIRKFKSFERSGFVIGTTTNGLLLTEKRAIELMEAGIDFITFSVDGADKKVYEKIRAGSNFDIVTSNIERLYYLKQKYNPELRVMMNFVIQPENIHQIVDMAKLAVKLKVNHLSFSYCLVPGTNNLNIFESEKSEKTFKEAFSVVKDSATTISVPPNRKVKNAPCLALESVCFLANGKPLPCAALIPGYCSPERLCNFGSLKNQTLSEIWNSEDYVAFRKNVLEKNYPSNCKDCYLLEYSLS